MIVGSTWFGKSFFNQKLILFNRQILESGRRFTLKKMNTRVALLKISR